MRLVIFVAVISLVLLVNPRVTDPATATVIKPEPLGSFTITAFCSCEICCGQWALNRPDGVVYGAHGVELEQGVSVASPLPVGTVIDIDGIGVRVVHDKTADWIVEKYDGRIIDVYFNSHEEAARFGKRVRDVKIVSRGK